MARQLNQVKPSRTGISPTTAFQRTGAEEKSVNRRNLNSTISAIEAFQEQENKNHEPILSMDREKEREQLTTKD